MTDRRQPVPGKSVASKSARKRIVSVPKTILAKSAKKVTFDVELEPDHLPNDAGRPAAKTVARDGPPLASSSEAFDLRRQPPASRIELPLRQRPRAMNPKAGSRNALDPRYELASKSIQVHSPGFTMENTVWATTGKAARKYYTGRGQREVARTTSIIKQSLHPENHSDRNRNDHRNNTGQPHYLAERFIVTPLMNEDSTDTSDSDETEVLVRAGPPAKAARKLQYGRKSIVSSGTIPATHISFSEDIGNGKESGQDTDSSEAGIDKPSDNMNGDHPPDHPDILPENTVAALPNEQEAEDYHLSDSFLAALDALTLGDTRMQSLHCLPFLLRNLRTGFQYRCHLCGIDTNIEVPPTAPITVIYSIRSAAENELGADSDVHIIEMSAWNCPLCKFHGTFKTKEILGKHLLWDHPTVGIIWTQDEDDLRLTLEIPSAEVTVAQQLTPQFEYAGPLSIVVPATPEFASNVASNDDLDAQMPTAATSQIEHVQPLPITVSTSSEFASNAAHKPEADTQMPQITVKPSYQEPPQTTPSEAATIEDDMKFKIRRDSPTPNPSRSSSRTFVGTSRATSRTSLHSSNKSTTPSAQPSRYPTPPPPTDPLGASAQFPYLPGDNSDALYSCRIGGPRLYDLLNTMSLDEFGVLSWVIVDREEEMFEVDDVRDEDKVMQALWTRWIFLNRNLFVANYPRGMRAFVEQNWRMIHRAAGWAALRQWLMIFMTHKFLSPVDIVEILKYYQGLTGMRHWYDAGGSQRDVSVGSDMTH